MVGEVGQDWSQLMPGPATERLILAAQMLGVAERAFDDL
ncbi:acyl-CoA dehydrogenase [Rhodococcus pyridinivorans AK37]|uniref:Acyl-CoA dehydrogenase n=1 Tax=Rhodococcus pyridinivorans AK37 TaxID=1114960 RepID=H0JNI5_9NOCA|nr:acyl-CoA dehydrogenase [Rhodococcus pyridinivorans AK37]